MIAELEKIDDECDMFGIQMVKLKDPQLAKRSDCREGVTRLCWVLTEYALTQHRYKAREPRGVRRQARILKIPSR